MRERNPVNIGWGWGSERLECVDSQILSILLSRYLWEHV